MSNTSITNLDLEIKFNSDNIQKAFSEFVDKPVWVSSNPDKEPINIYTGQLASCSDPASWATLPEVLDYSAKNPGYLPAIALIDSLGLVIIDLDHCTDGKQQLPWAAKAINDFESYTEISRGGGGLHIVIRATKPGHACKSGQTEIYSTQKFITLTGNVFAGKDTIYERQQALNEFYQETFKKREDPQQAEIKPSPPLSDDEVITLCRRAKNRDKFEALFDHGDTSAYGQDDSAADMALCSLLAFYTQKPEQIDGLFRKSKIYRKKWERKDYREGTIEKIIHSLKDTYQPLQKDRVQPEINTIDANWENPSPIEEGENLELNFPLSELPETSRIAVEETARCFKVDPALAALPAIGICSLSIGKKAVVVEKPGLKHQASLLLLGVANSGERKTSVFEAILGGTKEAIDKEIEEYQKQKAAIRAHNDLILDQINEIKTAFKKKSISKEIALKQLEDLYASEKEYPPEPFNFGSDITEPRLMQKLHEHGGAYGVFSSDGRSIIKKILGTKDGESGESVYLLGMWGDDLSRSRVGNNKGNLGGEDILIRKPALTTVAFIQPDLWEDLSKDSRMKVSGFISRISLVIPYSQMGTRLENKDDIPLDKEKIRGFTEMVLRIRHWKPSQPVEVFLCEAAADARRDFYNAIEKELGAGGKYEDVSDIATKATSITARIALNIAIQDAASTPDFTGQIPPISLEQWLRAQAIEEYFFAQSVDSRRTHCKSGPTHMLQKIAVWLKKQLLKKEGDGPVFVLASQIAKGVRGSKTTELEAKIIPALIAHHWIRITGTARGGTRKYEVNPRIVNAGR